MAMLIAPNGPSRDALLAALEGGDVRGISPEHPDFFTPALNAGAIVYAPSPPADTDRMRRVLGACNAPGVKMIVFVRTLDDALEPEERLLRREGKPYVVLAAPLGSPALGPALRRALSEGDLQGRVLVLSASAPEPPRAEAAPQPDAPSGTEAAPQPDAPSGTEATAKHDDPASAQATAEPDELAGDEPTAKLDEPASDERAPSARQTPTQITSKPGRAKATPSTSRTSPERPAPASKAGPAASAPWLRWLLPAAAIAVLVALQARGVRVWPSGCSVTPATKTLAPVAR